MKQTLIIMIILFHAVSGWCGTVFEQAFEWPFSAPTLFLQGGVNAVYDGGSHVFWAAGDTVAVVEKTGNTVVATVRLATSTAVQDMLYDGQTQTLFVAAGYDNRDGRGGLQVLSLADPASPSLISVTDRSEDNPGAYRDSETESVDVPDIDARGLGLDGTTLFLADDNFGLRVFDVSDPSAPFEIPLADQDDDRISGYKQPDINGSYMATGGYVNLRLYPYSGKMYAFVLDFYHGIRVFDVTDPTVIDDPYLKDTRTNIWFGSVSLLFDLYVTDTQGGLSVYVTGTNATGTEYAVSRLDADVDGEFSLTNLGRAILPGQARSVLVHGDYAYVADGTAGLSVTDMSDVPEEGHVLEYEVSGTYTSDVALSYGIDRDESRLYLASAQSGLTVLDPTDPVSPSFVDRIDPFFTADDVAVSGDVTALLDRDSGLRIFDGSEPSYMELEGYLALDDTATDLCLNGEYAYVSMASGGIRVIDVSDTSTPAFTGLTLNAPDPRSLCSDGSYLFVADGTSGLLVFDIRYPLVISDPVSAPCSGTPRSVFVSGLRAYVAQGGSGVDVFDVSDPSSPESFTTLATDDARFVSTTDSGGRTYALVADGDFGINIFDVTELPASLTSSVTTLEDDGTVYNVTANHIRVLRRHAYVAAGDQGVWALDITDPSAPSFLARRATSTRITETQPVLEDNTHYLTVAEAGAGLRVLYLYSSSDDDETEDLVPTIDSGCFLQTIDEPVMKNFFHRVASYAARWFNRITVFLNPYRP